MTESIPRATLKDRHAEVTRRAILEAARKLFGEKGYSTVSMKSLAEEAGLALQTIYTAFGSKAGVLIGLVDLLDAEAGVLDLVAQIQATEDPVETLGLFARIRRQIRERCSDIIHIGQAGARLDTDVGAMWAEGMRRRRGGIGMVTERLYQQHALKVGLSAERAADIIAALVVDEVCDVLVEQRGWSFDAYEAWLTQAMVELVLGPP